VSRTDTDDDSKQKAIELARQAHDSKAADYLKRLEVRGSGKGGKA
jgi:hypothetical protein